jgi:hypothetical protein
MTATISSNSGSSHQSNSGESSHSPTGGGGGGGSSNSSGSNSSSKKSAVLSEQAQSFEIGNSECKDMSRNSAQGKFILVGPGFQSAVKFTNDICHLLYNN